MRKIAVIIVFLLFSVITLGQTETDSLAKPIAQKNNAVYVEWLGIGLMWSINYERRIVDNFRIRVGHSNFDSEEGHTALYPVSGQFVIGEGNWKLDFGGGVTFFTSDIKEIDLLLWKYEIDSHHFFQYNFGGRFSPPESALVLKLYFAGLIYKELHLPTFGIGIGLKF